MEAKMKKLALVLLAIGFVTISIGGYQWLGTKHAQENSLEEAQTIIAEQNYETSDTAKTSTTIVENISHSIGETVGILHIPQLDADLPIVEGTDEDELEKGVGHYAGTAFPTQNDQIVLSGHRDTVFRRMGELELGDTLTLQLEYGSFSYEIVNTEIVDAEDRSIIVSTSPEEVLTMTTCYPFSFVGNSPERYVITALPIIKE